MKFEIIIAAVIALTLSSCQPGREKAAAPVRLDPEVRALAEEVLAPLKNPVTIRITRGGNGETTGEKALALTDLVASVSPLVTVTTQDIASDPDRFSPGVSHGPILEMKGQAPGVLRYYGFPERRETRPFLEGILLASGYQAELPQEVRSFIEALDEDVRIRIFVTPD